MHNKVDVKAKAKQAKNKIVNVVGVPTIAELINSAPNYFDFAICFFIRVGFNPFWTNHFSSVSLQIQPTYSHKPNKPTKNALKTLSFIFFTHHPPSSLITKLAVPTGNCQPFSFWSTVPNTTCWSTSFQLFDSVPFLSLIFSSLLFKSKKITLGDGKIK